VDDSLDVFAVHGVGGMIGSLLLAPFAGAAMGGAGFAAGLDMAGQFRAQAMGVGAAVLWSGAMTFLLAKGAALIVPMRVDAQTEHDGLDLSSHGERAYEFD